MKLEISFIEEINHFKHVETVKSEMSIKFHFTQRSVQNRSIWHRQKIKTNMNTILYLTRNAVFKIYQLLYTFKNSKNWNEQNILSYTYRSVLP